METLDRKHKPQVSGARPIQSPRVLPSRLPNGETTPPTVFWAFTQPAFLRIAMNIAQLFYELALIPDVAVVVALLPEVLRLANQSSRHTLLQRLERIS
jgi:hypothetical protein